MRLWSILKLHVLHFSSITLSCQSLMKQLAGCWLWLVGCGTELSRMSDVESSSSPEPLRRKYYWALSDAGQAKGLLRAKVLHQPNVSQWEGRTCSKANNDFFLSDIISPKMLTAVRNAVLYNCMYNLEYLWRSGQKREREKIMLKNAA